MTIGLAGGHRPSKKLVCCSRNAPKESLAVQAQTVEKPSARERVRAHVCSQGECCGIRLRGSAPKTPAGGSASCTSTLPAD